MEIEEKIRSLTKPYIFSELTQRKETTDMKRQEIYTLSEDEDSGLPPMNGEEEI